MCTLDIVWVWVDITPWSVLLSLHLLDGDCPDWLSMNMTP